ncbi:MAG: hypothetical protein NT069_33985 [Planctomycetota bacterium]|nr:hypothetical protein [Planctomycetota bacterium]
MDQYLPIAINFAEADAVVALVCTNWRVSATTDAVRLSVTVGDVARVGAHERAAAASRVDFR